MNPIRIAVIGVGNFGLRHLRVLKTFPHARIAGVLDTNPEAARNAAQEYGCPVIAGLGDVRAQADAAIVAAPTTAHAETAVPLLDAGLDVLVEKPITPDLESAHRLRDTAERQGRILQVGHLERFNPAISAIERIVTTPLFFEIHRLSLFSPRSLDIDVVLDLMIHDIDLLLSFTKSMPEEIRAAGLSILSNKVDIANVRLAFPGGCVANLTASRVSTERVRKLRLFQPFQYLSVDYQRQDAVAVSVSPERQVSFQPLPVTKDEPLRLELQAFLESVQSRSNPRVGGAEACRALEVALAITAKIEEHARVVARHISARPGGQPSA